MDVLDRVEEKVEAVADRYAHGHDRPMGPYGVLEAGYVALLAVLALAARKRKLPELSWRDILLIGIATHRLSRTLAKDPVTSPLRMWFTRYEGRGGPAELKEKVVADGLGHAVGELVTCPFCLAQWVATGFVSGMVFAPRATRLTAVCFSAVAISDFLQYAYAAAQQIEKP